MNNKGIKGLFTANSLYFLAIAAILTLSVTGLVSTRRTVERITASEPAVADSISTDTILKSISAAERRPESPQEPAVPSDMREKEKSGGSGSTNASKPIVSGSEPEPEAVSASQQTVSEPQEEAYMASAEAAVPVGRVFCIKPVAGPVQLPFSATELVYSSTFDDWRVHKALDIACEPGTPVCAMADGMVSDTYCDELFGNVIVIVHDDGLESTYIGLSAAEMVTPGQTVKAGDVIGAVGQTAVFESREPSHLHLEVRYNGELTDPAELFASIS